MHDADVDRGGKVDRALRREPDRIAAGLGRRAVQALANIVAPPTCDADLTGDGKVDGADLGVLLGTWGPCAGTTCPADINRDGHVNGADLGLVMGSFGWCPD